MGISAQEFWNTSKNGKAMVIFLCQRGVRGQSGDVELVRDICEWLVDQRQKGFYNEALKANANDRQAKIVAENKVTSMRAVAEAINDRNVQAYATQVIDFAFNDHMRAGPAAWEKIMSWFADKLRERVKAERGEKDF